MDKRTVNKIRAFNNAARIIEAKRSASQNDLQNKRKFITERAISPIKAMEKTIEDLRQVVKQELEYGRL